MKRCEWKDCLNVSSEGGTQMIAIQDPETGVKIIKTICSYHYSEWKNKVYNLAVIFSLVVPKVEKEGNIE